MIWACLAAAGFSGLIAWLALEWQYQRRGGLMDQAWREGYDQGCEDELASAAPCPCDQPGGAPTPSALPGCPQEAPSGLVPALREDRLSDSPGREIGWQGDAEARPRGPWQREGVLVRPGVAQHDGPAEDFDTEWAEVTDTFMALSGLDRSGAPGGHFPARQARTPAPVELGPAISGAGAPFRPPLAGPGQWPRPARAGSVVDAPVAGPVTNRMLERAVGREFLEAQRHWSDQVDKRLLTWAVGVLAADDVTEMIGSGL
jgi:hypothetical protein